MVESADWWGAINEALKKQAKKPPRVMESKEGKRIDADTAPAIPDRSSVKGSQPFRAPPEPPKKVNLMDDDHELPPRPSKNVQPVHGNMAKKSSPFIDSAEDIRAPQTQSSKAYQGAPSNMNPNNSSYQNPPPHNDPYSEVHDPYRETSPVSNPPSSFHTFQDSQPEAFKKMNLAEQMEFALNSAVKKPSPSMAAPEVETFTSLAANDPVVPKQSGNAWATFQDDSLGGW
jgi:hypothetical protein